MAEKIKTGSVLIKDGALLPDALQFESEPCATGWRLVKNLDGCWPIIIENGVTRIERNRTDKSKELQNMAESRWRTLYQAAVIEIDPEKVGARAIAAELAINSHIFADYQHISRDERSAMEHALSALDVLKLEGERSRRTQA